TRRRFLIWVLASLPLLVLILFIVRYRVEVPQADEWSLVPLIDKSYQGTLQLKDLWPLHNEHRLLFPRMLLIQIIKISHWQILPELITNVLFATISFLAMLSLMKRLNKFAVWLIPLFSLMIFSLNQSENWFLGWNVQIFMNVAAVILGLILIGESEFSGRRIVAAALLGIIATYSFANGFLFWPVAFLLLWQKRNSINRSPIVFSLWILIAAISFAFYIHGYSRPAEHPSPWHFLNEPLSALNYFFAYLGSPLLAFCKKTPEAAEWLSRKGFSVPQVIVWIANHAASFAGLIGFLLFIFAFQKMKKDENSNVVLIFFAMATYVLLSAVISTIARSGLGMSNALSLRYITISIWFWISLIIISAFEQQLKFKRICLTIVIVCIILNSIYGGMYSIKVHSYLMPARSEVLRLQDETLLKRLYPDVEYIRKAVPIMKRYNLSVFRGDHHSQ
ncbi:MAG TPA: hypothetical protein VH815_12710, partial [Acidobacteriota bacterium]